MTKEISIIDQAKKLIINSEKAFEAVLPKNFDVQKFIATFCLEVQKNEKLAQCTNLIEVARDVANFGLIIGGLANQAYLIPYWNSKKKSYVAQLIIGYRGYITKLEEAGYSVEVELVTNNEIDNGCFEELRGSETKIVHRPIRKGIRDRENIALAYCIIKGHEGSQIISVLSKEEMEEMGKTEKWTGSKEKGDLKKERGLSDVWLNEDRTTDYGQQCLKTVIRNCVKKVNLKIANEMSAYEGQRDVEIMKDVTTSKTANAHTPPAGIEKSFNVSDLKNGSSAGNDATENSDSTSTKTHFDDQNQIEDQIITNNDDVIELAFKRVSDGINQMANQKSVETFFSRTSAEDVAYLYEKAPALHAELLEIKKRRLEELK